MKSPWRHTDPSTKPPSHDGPGESFFSRAKNFFFGPKDQPGLGQRATSGSGRAVSNQEKQPLEKYLGEKLDHISVHDNAASHRAAESIHANAFTIGNQIHFSAGASAFGAKEKETLLVHEMVHAVQQRNMPATVTPESRLSHPGDAEEQHAVSVAGNFGKQSTGGYHSSALGIRNAQRIGQVSRPVVHRDIKGFHNLPFGKMEVDFAKQEGAAAGDQASENGEVRFHPGAGAPESDDIRLLQIVRTTDVAGITGVAAGEPVDYANVGPGDEADRNKVMTTLNVANNVAGGFFIDHFANVANPRTAKADAAVSPFYNAYGAGAIGKRRGAVRNPATLVDGPGSTADIRFNFVTSAKAKDTGVWYGTVLWGFEIFHDKAGIAKIKNEYKSFRQFEGETTHAALDAFNTFYKNPGTAGAP